MARKPNPLLKEFLNDSLPLPTIHWETVPPGINPWDVWDSYDEGVEGWVPIWYPIGDPKTGRSYGEFERAFFFNEDMERVLKAINCWPLWGSPTQKKHAVAIVLLQLFCEMMGLCEKA